MEEAVILLSIPDGNIQNMEKPDLLQGTLDMLILKVSAVNQHMDSAFASGFKKWSADVLSLGEGSLYPALYRLQDNGWIEAQWGQSEHNRRAKYYKLTKASRKQLEAESKEWDQMCLAIRK